MKLARKRSSIDAFKARIAPPISLHGLLVSVSYTDFWSFDEINAVKCTERLLSLPRGRLGGGRFSLLTPAFDVQEIMLTLA